jgi:hypothetical protein
LKQQKSQSEKANALFSGKRSHGGTTNAKQSYRITKKKTNNKFRKIRLESDHIKLKNSELYHA